MSCIKTLRGLVAGSLLLGSSVLAAPTTLAQDNDDQEYGAYLYAASCDDLSTDAVVDDIGELEFEDDDDDVEEHWRVLGNDQDAPDRLFAEDEDVDDLTVDDLLAETHAIAVHADENRDSDVIACGDITGESGSEALLIALDEVDDSGFEGRAHMENDDRSEDVDVTVGIWEAGAVAPLGTPVPTPRG